MRFGKHLLAACAALLVSTQAQAAQVSGQISVGGFAAPVGAADWFSATGYDANNGSMASPGTPGGLTFYGAGTGSFVGLSCFSAGTCGTLADILNFGTFSPITGFLTLNTSGISFDLNSITNISRVNDAQGGSLTLSGAGVINFTGFDPTPGIFTLTAQGRNITSFSASALSAAVPEPGTWAMMLLGFGALGFSLRRRRQQQHGMIAQLG